MTERKWRIFRRWASVRRPNFSKLDIPTNPRYEEFVKLVDALMETCDLDATEANLNALRFELVPLNNGPEAK